MSDEVDFQMVAQGFVFPESPRWHAGAFYFCDVFGGRVHRVDSDGSVFTLFEDYAGLPSAVGWDRDSSLLIALMRDRRLVRVSQLGAGAVETVADLTHVTRGSINDMVVDEQGRSYIGNVGFDFGQEPVRPSHLVLVEPDGSASPQGEGLFMPNGICLTPDGGTLIVAETFGGRLTSFDIAVDGSLSAQSIWAELGARQFDDVGEAHASGQCLPDGIALDEEGAVWVADSSGGPVLRVAEGGQVLDSIDTGDLTAFAVSLGGKDRRTLYLALSAPIGAEPTRSPSGTISTTRVAVPGAGLP